jgi:gliding motility-associated-like protein
MNFQQFRFAIVVSLLYFSQIQLTTGANTDLILVDSFKMTAANVSNAAQGSTISIPVSVANFRNMVILRFSMMWNSSVLQYTGASDFNLAGLTASHFDATQASTGRLAVVWTDNTARTLTDNTILFKLNFTVTASTGVPQSLSFLTPPFATTEFGNSGTGFMRYLLQGSTITLLRNCTSPVGGLTCQTATSLCNNDLTNYCGALGGPNTQTNPGNMGCSSIDNNQWFSFVAGSTDLEMRVRIRNCNGGPTGIGDGLQIIAMTSPDCTHFTRVGNCYWVSPFTASSVFSLTDLTVGNRYYLMLDGYNGDICDFTLQLENGTLLNSGGNMPTTVTGASSVCANQTTSFSIPAVTGATNYTWTFPTGATAMGATNVTNVSVRWGNVAGNVCVAVTDACGTTAPICKTVSMSSAVTSEVMQPICANTCFRFGGVDRCATGDYTATFTAASGCDSIVTLHLRVLTPIMNEITREICAGSCFNFNGTDRCAAGDYTATFRSYLNCDSVVTLHLRVLNQITNEVTQEICAGGCYRFNNIDRCTAGDYAATFRTATGCDSIVTLHLRILQSVTAEITREICAGTCFNFNNISHCVAGDYTATFRSYLGCDSIVTMHLRALNAIRTEITREICTGSCFNLGGTDRCAAGDYTATLRSYLGCDSIVTLHLRLLNSVTNTIARNICAGSCFNFGGTDRCATGNYTATFRSYLGCDSIVTLQLRVLNSISTEITEEICSGACFRFNNMDQCVVGDYTATFRSYLGCDSIVTLHLRQFAAARRVIDTTVCEGGSVQMNNQSFSSATQNIILPRGSWRGCDSILVLNITFLKINQPIAFSNGNLSCVNRSVTLTGRASVEPVQSTVRYEWKNTGGAVIGTDSTKVVASAGTYTVTITATLNGVSCFKTATITVTQSGNVPAQPAMRGAISVCRNEINTYNIVNPTAGILSYNWQVPAGVQLTSLDPPLNSNITVHWGNSNGGQIAVAAENACGTSTSAYLNVVIRTLPNTVVINGVSTICANTVARFNTPADTSIYEYRWRVPTGAQIVTGANTREIEIRFGNTGGQVCLQTRNLCGFGADTCFETRMSTQAPDSIALDGLIRPCPNSITPYTYTIPLNANITSYQWSVPSDARIEGGQGTNSLNVNWLSSVGGRVCLTLQNACGISRQLCTDSIRVRTNLPDSLPINGNGNVCAGAQEPYSIERRAGMTYQWVIPSGATILTGQNTESIQINWGASTGGQVCVDVKNACNLVKRICLNVNVRPVLPDSFPINGSRQVCPNSTATYTIRNQAGVQYSWRVVPSTAGRVQTGGNTNAVEIVWENLGNATVCLTMLSNCAGIREICIPVAVGATDTLAIGGNANPCATQRGIYTVAGGSASYTWTVPTGASIISGNSTSAITVNWGTSTNGFITVTPSTGCAAGRTSQLYIDLQHSPVAPNAITGRAIVGNNTVESYTIVSVPNATRYAWVIPTGASIVGNTQGTSIQVNWGNSRGGNICVQAVNDCGESIETCLSVTVYRRPVSYAGANDTVCGNLYILRAGVSVGAGRWSIVSMPPNGTVRLGDVNSYNTPAAVSELGLYTFQWKEVNGVFSDSARVTIYFKERPHLTRLSDSCSLDVSTYQTRLLISGGTPTYQWHFGTRGTIVGNIFTTNLMASGSSYNVAVKDMLGCISDTLTDNVVCQCLTAAGTMDTATVKACYGAAVRVQHHGDAVQDANDTYEYLLHDGTINSIGTIVSRNRTGSFDFQTGMQYDKRYYVTYVVGNDVNGRVNQNEYCFAKTRGTAVIFKSRIMASFMGDTAVCVGGTARIRLNINQNSRFNITYNNNISANTTLNGVASGYELSTAVYVPLTYRLIGATDTDGCHSVVMDSVQLRLRTSPMAQAGTDIIVCENQTSLNAVSLLPQQVGIWTALNGATVSQPTVTQSFVNQLHEGRNLFVWTVRDSICPNQRPALDTVVVNVPETPKANDFSFVTKVGEAIHGDLTEYTPTGNWQVRHITYPQAGRFILFNNGKFDYEPPTTAAIVNFKYTICNGTCSMKCDTGMVRIKIDAGYTPPKDTTIDIPNAFTPNGDTKNDLFYIKNLENYPNAELMVFSRWGDILYRASDYRNDWNGQNSNGEPLPEGTYYYILRLNVADGKILKGDITILR